MFKGKTPPEEPEPGQDPDEATGPSEAVSEPVAAAGVEAEAEAAGEVEDLRALRRRLDELIDVAEDASDVPPERSAEETAEPSEHAELLHATRSAHRQAQRLLAVATRTRNEASVQAEKILQEAQDAAVRLQREAAADAERTRQEATARAESQRREVEKTVAALTRAAEADAQKMRGEAERAAMVIAQAVAKQYVDQVARAADQDAEAIRGRAREVLARATTAAHDIERSVRDFSDSISTLFVATQRQATALGELVEETAEEGADDDEATPPESTSEEPTELEKQVYERVRLDLGDDLPDLVARAQGQDQAAEADTPPAGEPGEPGEAGEPPAGWPLGSLFRQLGSDDW